MAAGHVREDEEDRGREQAARASVAPAQPVREPAALRELAAPHAPMTAAGVLALQQRAGNAAVQRAILARDDTATAAPAGGAKTPDEAFADALKAGDYDKLAVILNSVYSWTAASDKIDELDEDQLRRLDDAARRVLTGSGAAWMLVFIRSKLGDLGVEEEQQEPGRQYGEIEIEIIKVDDGLDTGPKAGRHNYGYSMKIEFTPDMTACKADTIAFIQRVRLVETATGKNKDWDKTNRERATERQSSIDRIPGKEQGWYGVANDLSDQGNLQTWTRTGPEVNASMTDRPSARMPNTTWEFETAAVSRSGPDEGTVYAVVNWGFTVDEDLKVTGLPNQTFNKPTKDFDAAVAAWNKQAAGPKGKRSAPKQKALPGLK
jgi:hypothetical protein